VAKLHPFTILGLVRDIGAAAANARPIAVGGARALTGALVAELGRGARPGAVREGGPEGAAAFVYVLAGSPTAEDERLLRAARRERVPTLCVLAGPELDGRVPYVLATDVVRVPAGVGFPVDEIAEVLARKLDEAGASVAARVPVLRPAVCDHLIESFSRKNGFLGAAVFLKGADLPVLTLNQIRLVLLLAAAHGVEVDQQRVPEIAGVVAGGLGFRALARRMLRAAHGPTWAVKGLLAYTGTRAVGEAARRYFEARAAAPAPVTSATP
jgi:uncharacterized protein (DUF697 family)